MKRIHRQIVVGRALVTTQLFVVEQASIELSDQPLAIGFVGGIEMIGAELLELDASTLWSRESGSRSELRDMSVRRSS